jgi:hypothetical protein
MNGRILVGLFLCSLFLVVGGDAQSPDIPFSGYTRADGEKPIWALEFIKVQPENFVMAMQYLDDHWMRVRAEAKRHGAVLDYQLISNAGIVTPGHKAWDQDSIVLLTKYKNMDAFVDSQHASRLAANGFRYGYGVLQPVEDLFEQLNTQVFVEEPDTSTGVQASHQAAKQ